jgi:predicted RNase H-like HicB family nuclease
MRNTYRSGHIRNIIFKEGGTWYGVALEFNIVETGDDPREVMLLLDEAMRGYIKSAIKSKLSESVLNQKTDPEYEKLWNSIESNKSIKSPYKVYSSASVMVKSLI